jgi:hypothetical protein
VAELFSDSGSLPGIVPNGYAVAFYRLASRRRCRVKLFLSVEGDTQEDDRARRTVSGGGTILDSLLEIQT